MIMTSTLKRKIKKPLRLTLLLLILFFSFTPIFSLQAQNSLTLSVSPTLFDMFANPGQNWKSSIKIINVNDYDLTVYANVVDFVPKGETGTVSFVPVDKSDTDRSTLGSWITVTSEPIIIPREQTVEVPFMLEVPFEATPGGHYAAILIGTKPLEVDINQSKVQTSQMVTTLFFTRIEGDVIESGEIREFTTNKSLFQEPVVDFSLRFENKGNVYLQPQGEIKILNMWGEERGVIPINQKSSYGKVPHKTEGTTGIRNFKFSWTGEWSITDIGRYSAIATLAYGQDQRQFSTSKAYFWVIPIKSILIFIITISLFIYLSGYLIRLYVRRMLKSAGLDVSHLKAEVELNDRLKSKRHLKIHIPTKEKILDLKSGLVAGNSKKDRLIAVWDFFNHYKFTLLVVLLLMLLILFLIWYIKGATADQRSFAISYNDGAEKVEVSSEQIMYNELKGTSDLNKQDTEIESKTNNAKILIVNRSGETGAAAKLRINLEEDGYRIDKLEADLEAKQEKTVIVYKREYQEEAIKLSEKLNNALISVTDETEINDYSIVIYLGSNLRL